MGETKWMCVEFLKILWDPSMTAEDFVTLIGDVPPSEKWCVMLDISSSQRLQLDMILKYQSVVKKLLALQNKPDTVALVCDNKEVCKFMSTMRISGIQVFSKNDAAEQHCMHLVKQFRQDTISPVR